MVRISPVVIWSSVAKSLLAHIWLVLASQFSVAAFSAAVWREAGGALTGADPAPAPHAAAARPAPARSAVSSGAVLYLRRAFISALRLVISAPRPGSRRSGGGAAGGGDAGGPRA